MYEHYSSALNWGKAELDCRAAGGFYIVQHANGMYSYHPYGEKIPSDTEHIKAWVYYHNFGGVIVWEEREERVYGK